MSVAEVYDPRQISAIIESLAHEAMNQNTPTAKETLKLLFDSLNGAIDPQMRSNFLKLFAVLSYLDGNFAKAQEIIRSGQFDEFHHEFLRDLYKKCEMMYVARSSSPNRESIILYPESIETKDEDGIPITIAEYLKTYYIQRKISKKAMNLLKVAEKTNLSVEVVTRRLEHHRDMMRPTRAVSRPRKAKKAKQMDPLQLNVNPEPIYYPMHQDLFPFLPSPPMEHHDLFPTHRIPLDQPLTIIIPY